MAKKKSVSPMEDKSPKIPQRDKIKNKLNIIERYKLSDKQDLILSTCLEKDTRCVMLDGVWGTSKTYLLTLAALKLLDQKRIGQIYYIRNPITASVNSQIGYIPGDLNEKMAPYNAVLFEKLEELLPAKDISGLLREKRIEFIPTGFLQGRSFNCSVLIVDEAASMSWEDLMLIISRAGEFTRVFIAGDTINQVYLSNKSGYQRFFRLFDDEESTKNGVFTFELKECKDIVRSDFLKFIMKKTGVIKG